MNHSHSGDVDKLWIDAEYFFCEIMTVRLVHVETVKLQNKLMNE